MSNKVISILVATIALLASSNSAYALACDGVSNGYCLNDRNSFFEINSRAEMEVVVDGSTHQLTTDFVYIENQLNPDGTVDHTTTQVANIEGSSMWNYLVPTYPNAPTGTYSQLSLSNMSDILNNTWATVDIDFNLTGSAIGSNTATIAQTFTITNNDINGLTRGFNLFSWTDIDLVTDRQIGVLVDELGEIIGYDSNGKPTGYRQYEPADEVITTVDVVPDYYEMSFTNGCSLDDICDRIFNTADTQLLNTVDQGYGGRVNQAVQYVKTLELGQSFTFTHTMVVNPVPVPAAAWLFGSGLIGLVGFARRKK